MSLRAEPGGPLTQFVDRDGLTAWASHSGLMAESFFDGDKGHFPIPEEVKWENETVMKSLVWVNRSRSCEKCREIGRDRRSRLQMVMEQRILERVSREFQDSDRDAVVQLLESYVGPESDRVRWDILELSKGGLGKVRDYMKAAQTDYRDVLYWAEYFKDDPMLHGRDPKQMVSEILVKWGKKGR
jgi:hypothetical protein